ncbi:hypothetical protein ACW9UR_11080 [Halovulum sp. GXIMD14794]|mgnify:CR=1 FL=1
MKTIALATAITCVSFTFALGQAASPAQINQVQNDIASCCVNITLPDDVTPEQLAQIQALLESEQAASGNTDTLEHSIKDILGMN